MRCLDTGIIRLSSWITGQKHEAASQFHLVPRLRNPAPLSRFLLCARLLWCLSSNKSADYKESHGVGRLVAYNIVVFRNSFWLHSNMNFVTFCTETNCSQYCLPVICACSTHVNIPFLAYRVHTYPYISVYTSIYSMPFRFPE